MATTERSLQPLSERPLERLVTGAPSGTLGLNVRIRHSHRGDPKNGDHFNAPQVSRFMLTVPIGLPSLARYSRTTTTPWSMSGRRSGFVQLAFVITEVNLVPNVVALMPSDSAFTSVYMLVSLSPGPALAPSSLVFGSTAAGAAWLACPAISASCLSSNTTERDGVGPPGSCVWGCFAPHPANAANASATYFSCVLCFTPALPKTVVTLHVVTTRKGRLRFACAG